VDNVFGVKIANRADELGKHAAHQGRPEHVAVLRRHVKKVAARAVAQHQDGARRLDAPGLEIHQ
jgi:hypothetical protein